MPPLRVRANSGINPGGDLVKIAQWDNIEANGDLPPMTDGTEGIDKIKECGPSLGMTLKENRVKSIMDNSIVRAGWDRSTDPSDAVYFQKSAAIDGLYRQFDFGKHR